MTDDVKTGKSKSRPPQAVLTRYEVLRDTSEKLGWVFPRTEHCAGTREYNLYTGDYSLEGYYDPKLFIIERKGSVAELVQNITNKEKWDDFKQELERLEEFRWPFVICEFPLSLIESYPVGSTVPKRVWPSLRVKPQFLLMRLEEIFLHFKTRWLFCDTPGLAQQVASGLFKRVIERVPDPTAA